MLANAPASSGAGRKTTALIRTARRLAVALSLTALLVGAKVSADGEDGPMASAPLPPPLPAAPSGPGLRWPEAGRSAASHPALPRPHLRTDSTTHAAQLHQRGNDRHAANRFARGARGQKRLSQRAVGDGEHRNRDTVPQIANAMTPPPAPLPFPYGYFPGTPPAYGYSPVYPPPWPPGPILPH